MAATFASALVALSLALSGLSKLLDLRSFHDAVDDFSLLSAMPRFVRHVISAIVPAAEVAVAVLLLLDGTARIGAVSAAILSGSFVVVVGFDARPTIAHCGCWGVSSEDIPKAYYLSRSVVLLVAAVASTAVFFTPSESWHLKVVECALAAPFALLLLELPQIGLIVNVQKLARGA